METTNNTLPSPFIKTGQALLSFRDNGYTIEAAIAEVIDNSIEAQANEMNVILFPSENKGKKSVNEVALLDDGSGMDFQTLHYYLQIGFSTRYMSETTIGKYGVGAKLAALNFGKRIEVWSRQANSQPWMYVYFDLDEMLAKEKNGEDIAIDAPTQKEPPAELIGKLEGKTGTAVLWSKVDRLEEGRYAVSFDELKSHLEKELGRMFRHFIDGGIKLIVNDKQLLAHDPLYLMKNSFSDVILKSHYSKANDPTKVKDHYEATVKGNEPIEINGITTTLKVTLYPKEVTRKRLSGGDELAKKLRLPDNEGAISFVRLNREVSYTNVPRIFPVGVKEADRHIGIEVSFDPRLDSYFGVRNVKRGVEPHGELRNKIRTVLAKYIKIARKQLNEQWGEVENETKAREGEHSLVIEAAGNANLVMPKGRVKPLSKKKEQEILNDIAKDATGSTDPEKIRLYLERTKNQPFILESVDFPGNQFVDIKHLPSKVIIRLNTRHRFYREMWEPIKRITEGDPSTLPADEVIASCKRTIEALTLLLIAYGKAESMDENPEEKYRDLTGHWGQFLETLMGRVKDVI
jgi:hypothetical protein